MIMQTTARSAEGNCTDLNLSSVLDLIFVKSLLDKAELRHPSAPVKAVRGAKSGLRSQVKFRRLRGGPVIAKDLKGSHNRDGGLANQQAQLVPGAAVP